MINNITVTTITTHGLSPTLTIVFLVLIAAFLVSVGITYHSIRNKEYKDTLRASIIIGFVISFLFVLRSNMEFNSFSYNLRVIQWILFIFILVMVGGFIAVSMKKLANEYKMEEFQESLPEKDSENSKNWWDRQNPKTQAITVLSACLLCIILLTGVMYLLNPFEGQVKLGITFTPGYTNETEVNEAMNEGIIVIFISNNTTQYTLKGVSETGATVKITSSDLGIYNQTVPLDADGNFAYNLNIPLNATKIKVEVEATKTGKEPDYDILSIKRH